MENDLIPMSAHKVYVTKIQKNITIKTQAMMTIKLNKALNIIPCYKL